MKNHPGRWLLISLGVALAATAVAFAVAGTRKPLPEQALRP